jgi:hypothetical protein
MVIQIDSINGQIYSIATPDNLKKKIVSYKLPKDTTNSFMQQKGHLI